MGSSPAYVYAHSDYADDIILKFPDIYYEVFLSFPPTNIYADSALIYQANTTTFSLGELVVNTSAVLEYGISVQQVEITHGLDTYNLFGDIYALDNTFQELYTYPKYVCSEEGQIKVCDIKELASESDCFDPEIGSIIDVYSLETLPKLGSYMECDGTLSREKFYPAYAAKSNGSYGEYTFVDDIYALDLSSQFGGATDIRWRASGIDGIANKTVMVGTSLSHPTVFYLAATIDGYTWECDTIIKNEMVSVNTEIANGAGVAFFDGTTKLTLFPFTYKDGLGDNYVAIMTYNGTSWGYIYLSVDHVVSGIVYAFGRIFIYPYAIAEGSSRDTTYILASDVDDLGVWNLYTKGYLPPAGTIEPTQQVIIYGIAVNPITERILLVHYYQDNLETNISSSDDGFNFFGTNTSVLDVGNEDLMFAAWVNSTDGFIFSDISKKYYSTLDCENFLTVYYDSSSNVMVDPRTLDLTFDHNIFSDNIMLVYRNNPFADVYAKFGLHYFDTDNYMDVYDLYHLGGTSTTIYKEESSFLGDDLGVCPGQELSYIGMVLNNINPCGVMFLHCPTTLKYHTFVIPFKTQDLIMFPDLNTREDCLSFVRYE